MRSKTIVPSGLAALAVLAVITLLAAAAPAALAQEPPDQRPLQLYADIGYVNLFSYPKWISIGPELELRLGRLFSIDPGLMLWIGQSPRQKVRVVPALTANVRLGRITLGGGAVYRVSDWPESGTGEITGTGDHGWLMPEAQISYMLGPTRLALSLHFPGGGNSVAVGLTLGMRIGRPSRED